MAFVESLFRKDMALGILCRLLFSSRPVVLSDTAALEKAATSLIAERIPEALSLDRIVAGGTCPPCTNKDFMNYLLYIEHSAENLQFYLWLLDYEKRFEALDPRDKLLSPEWDRKKSHPSEQPISLEALKLAKTEGGKVASQIVAEAGLCGKGPQIPSPTSSDSLKINPFQTPPTTPNTIILNRGETAVGTVASESSTPWSRIEPIPHHSEAAAEAFSSADLNWQPFTIQPFRKEITRVIALYIAPGSLRELNLATKERSALLHALEHTTHPSAFRGIKVSIDWTLRFQAHPNFIRWTICNGNKPRGITARIGSSIIIVIATVAAVLVSLGSSPRGWIALASLGWFIGVATLFAAWKGLCILLHGFRRRHLRPWELWDPDESSGENTYKDPFDYLLSENNSYEDEPWVSKYKNRNLFRKVFDKEVWIEEPTLRRLQDIIFIQSIMLATISSGLLTALFVFIPRGHFF